MNLVTPDSGLLFWMVLIFLIVLGILWKFGFPMITGMVEKRTAHIDDSLRLAREAEERMKGLAEEQKKLIEDTQRQQSQMLKDAANTRDAIIAQARDEARQQADIMIEKARVEIATEKESAMRDVRRDVAELSVQIAEKILRDRLTPEQKQSEYLDKLIGEIKEETK